MAPYMRRILIANRLRRAAAFVRYFRRREPQRVRSWSQPGAGGGILRALGMCVRNAAARLDRMGACCSSPGRVSAPLLFGRRRGLARSEGLGGILGRAGGAEMVICGAAAERLSQTERQSKAEGAHRGRFAREGLHSLHIGCSPSSALALSAGSRRSAGSSRRPSPGVRLRRRRTPGNSEPFRMPSLGRRRRPPPPKARSRNPRRP